MMISVTKNGEMAVLLSPVDIKDLKDGGVVEIPGTQVELSYTPDLMWCIEQMKIIMNQEPTGVPSWRMSDVHKESMSRPEVYEDEKVTGMITSKSLNPFRNRIMNQGENSNEGEGR